MFFGFSAPFPYILDDIELCFHLSRISIRRNEWRFRRETYLSMRIFTCDSLTGEIFLFKVVKMDLTNLRRKNSPKLLEQSKHKYILIFDLSVNRWLLII